MTPPWLKLIRHHQRRHRLALTLPFLVGALRQPIGAQFEREQEAYAALVSLLTCFRDEVLNTDAVRIHTCPDLDQPVASITSTRYRSSYAGWKASEPRRLPLDIDPLYRPDPPTDASAAARQLWPRVSSPILEARFSFSRAARSCRPFDENDRKFIVDALAYDEENEPCL